MHSQLNGAQPNDKAALKYYDTLKFQIFHLALNNYVWSDVRRVLAYTYSIKDGPTVTLHQRPYLRSPENLLLQKFDHISSEV